MALGVTMQLPLDDKHTYTREYLETRLAIMMGGRLAEELFLGTMTTGAGNDIEQASELARKMVCEFGMSGLGPITFGKKEEQIFLGREISQHRDFSEDTAIKIDSEVRRLVDESYNEAKEILENNRPALSGIAAALLEREVLDAHEVQMIIEGKTLPARVSPNSHDDQGGVQQVLKPEPSRQPGLPQENGLHPRNHVNLFFLIQGGHKTAALFIFQCNLIEQLAFHRFPQTCSGTLPELLIKRLPCDKSVR